VAIVYLNGRYLPLEEAAISPLDRGFLFADGVYEVIPVYNGHLFRLAQHLQRLETSLAGIRVIHDYLPPEVRQGRDLDETIRIEKKFSRHPLYARLGRYLHLMLERH